MSTLSGRVVIVTGAGRGIGRCHALLLAAEGATVVVNDPGVGRDGDGGDEGPAQLVAEEIDALGGVAVPDLTSVTDWDGTGALIARTVERFGRLDGVVNNAGVLRDRMLTSASERDFDVVVGVHLKGTYAMSAHTCVHWRSAWKDGDRTGGRIVNTTSASGLLGNVGQSVYGAAKAAIASLTTITAMEMGRYGVTANAISPIAMTRMIADLPGMAQREESVGFDPLDPGNSSPVVAYLVSEAAAWLTGQVLRVEGNVLRRFHPWHVGSDAVRARDDGQLDVGELHDAVRRLYGAYPASLTTPGLGS